RSALASAGYAPARETSETAETTSTLVESDASVAITAEDTQAASLSAAAGHQIGSAPSTVGPSDMHPQPASGSAEGRPTPLHQERIDFAAMPIQDEESVFTPAAPVAEKGDTARDLDAIFRDVQVAANDKSRDNAGAASATAGANVSSPAVMPPLASAAKFLSEVALDSVSANIRPIGQLEESFIVATDEEGLLLIDQHVAHERILFDKYRALEGGRVADSQNLLIPETFDLTPAQAAAFDSVAQGLESYGFDLMRLSGRTVAIKATPADLPASEARNMLAEVLDAVDAEKKGAARATQRDEIAASLACHAAIKINTPLAPEKMRWLIDRLLLTSSPTTCPHGRPVLLRIATQDILKGFHRI
ncbi:MAG: hypothetical protein ABI923_13190, partial [bacterium]